MNEAHEQFARRLGEDVARVLGEGIHLDEITVEGEGTDGIELHATCLFDGRAERITGRGETLPAAASDLVRVAAEFRLAIAWRTLVVPL